VLAEAPIAAGSLLSVLGVTKRFGGVTAVSAASFDVVPGSITALIGPNGAGKSTLFNVVTGFERGDRGDVLFEGRSVYGASPHVIARRGMVRTFQLTKALSVMTVIDNVLLADPGNPGERLAVAAFRPLWRNRERGARRRALELLDVFGMSQWNVPEFARSRAIATQLWPSEETSSRMLAGARLASTFEATTQSTQSSSAISPRRAVSYNRSAPSSEGVRVRRARRPA